MKWGYYYYSLFTVRGVEIYGAHVSYVHFFGRSLFCAFAIGSGGLREGVGFELRERERGKQTEKNTRDAIGNAECTRFLGTWAGDTPTHVLGRFSNPC